MAEAQNALFTEELVDSKSPYTDLQIGDADNGTTWYWFYDNKTTANSRDYGEFTILQGVSFDGTKKTIEDILTTAKLEGLDISGTLEQLEEIGEKFGISFIISVSLDKEEIPAEFQDKIATAL